jgi:four helix bundle protein
MAKVVEKKFDLEERTLKFSKKCIDICNSSVKNPVNLEIIPQLIRSAGSVGANYREANESSTSKDFYYRISICRKEAKESNYWLDLLEHANPVIKAEIGQLSDEARQLARIFASIVIRNFK